MTDFSDLEALLAESVAAQAEAGAVKAARARQALGKQSKEEQAADAARIAEWSARHEWQSVAQVAIFETVVCQHCDSATTIFTGLFVKQVGRNNQTSRRWLPPGPGVSFVDLPKQTAIRERAVAWCSTCIEEQGFDFLTPEVLS